MKAALMCGLMVLLWPASSSAEVGRCVENSVSELAQQGVTSFLLTSSDEADQAPSDRIDAADRAADVLEDAPCSTDPDADPSSNFCFEDAEGQISTLPSLLAKWRGEEAANSMIGSMFDAVELANAQADAGQGDDGQVEPSQIELSVEVDPDPVEPDEASCSSNPDECRSLPPAPPSLTVDASAPAASQPLHQADIPVRLSTDDSRAWAPQQLGPRHGHRDPPDQPPRA